MEPNNEKPRTLTRRDMIKMAAAGAALACAGRPRLVLAQAQADAAVTAAFWEKTDDGRVACLLCPNGCLIGPGKRGTCQVRENRNGELKTLVHSRPCSLNNDPIEKKPLFHYRPGTLAFSLATAGCNLRCKFCQNWEISQFPPEQVQSQQAGPEEIVRMARSAGSRIIAFTYSEPVVFYEYVRDICKAARGTGLGRVIVSNGYIERKPLEALLQDLDAVKIDFKSFSEGFYTTACSGHLKPVLGSIELIRSKGVWLELVVLLVPTLNDDLRQIEMMCRWIFQKLGPDVPLHFTRFHPTYKMTDLPPTPIATLEKAHEIGLNAGLHYVYAGNVPGHPSENTYCPYDKTLLIQRVGFEVVKNDIQNGACPTCHRKVPGVWT